MKVAAANSVDSLVVLRIVPSLRDVVWVPIVVQRPTHCRVLCWVNTLRIQTESQLMGLGRSRLLLSTLELVCSPEWLSVAGLMDVASPGLAEVYTSWFVAVTVYLVRAVLHVVRLCGVEVSVPGFRRLTCVSGDGLSCGRLVKGIRWISIKWGWCWMVNTVCLRDEPRRLSQQACGVSLPVVWDLSDSKVLAGTRDEVV